MSANRNKARPASGSSRQVRQRHIPVASLPERSQAARDGGFHVLAAMRRDPDLTATRAAELEGISYRTVKKYFGSELEKVGNRYRVTPSDRRIGFVFLPDESGNVLRRKTTSSKDREQAGAFLADFNRYLRGDSTTLAKWQNVKIGGLGLLTDPRTIKATEPALSDFSLYRAFNGGAV